MFTNTYTPHVSGVARSVATVEEDLRALGHKVHVVAPEFEGAEESTYSCTRMAAVQRFSGTDFSMRIPFPGATLAVVDAFRPDVVHSHHPFLLGDAAARAALSRELPLVFTYHTRYEEYTRYVPVGWPVLRRLAIELSTAYANLCSLVIAPSGSIRDLLRERGVGRPIRVIPTGVDVPFFAGADGVGFRARHGIPRDAVVLGHVGRLAGEKNLLFLAEAAAIALDRLPEARFMVAGHGDVEDEVFRRLRRYGERVVRCGTLHGAELADCYAAMDLFVFSSKSETQGMVLAEAMAAGVPVVALDASGVRDIVETGVNGELLDGEAPPEAFASAVCRIARDETERKRLAEGGRGTAARFARSETSRQIEAAYLVALRLQADEGRDLDGWERAARRIGAEWTLVSRKLAATAAAVSRSNELRESGQEAG